MRAILLGSSSFYHKQEATTRLNGLSDVPSVHRRRLLHNFTIRYQGSRLSYRSRRYCVCMRLYTHVFFSSPINNNIRELNLCYTENFADPYMYICK